MKTRQILLTNDDGIESPGLLAAAAALSELGYVTVAAPRGQFSGAGRSLPKNSDGIIELRKAGVNGQTWTVFAVGGTPAQTVLHGVLEILSEPPDLVVSGINYGENLGTGITASGTIGAALEAASLGLRSLAVSLETEQRHHHSHSAEVDFSTAAYFTTLFARLMLSMRLPEDVDVLKVDVPCDATPATPWEVTRLSHKSYYVPTRPQRASWDTPGTPGYRVQEQLKDDVEGTDVYALHVKRVVAVTPLSLDMTSRVSLEELGRLFRAGQADS